MNDRIKAAERIIKHGGQIIHDAFHTSFTKREKTRHDYVTQIDESIENLIDKEVKKLFPEDAILGEENGEIKGTSLGQTPVIYSYQESWESIMNNTTAFDSYPLWDSEFPSPPRAFPASLPSGFPTINAMPNPYGGWSGTDPVMEQQQYNVEVAKDSNPNDEVDADAVSGSWLYSLPHQN